MSTPRHFLFQKPNLAKTIHSARRRIRERKSEKELYNSALREKDGHYILKVNIIYMCLLQCENYVSPNCVPKYFTVQK